MLEKIAVLSDIHANVWALDAVLEDARRRGAQAVINLGDAVYGPLAPAETSARLMGLKNLVSILGNQDRLLLEEAGKIDRAGNPTLDFVLEDLGEAPLAWLAGLPAEDVFFDILYCCHGAPGDDARYLLEDVSSGRPAMRPAKSLAAMLASVAAPVVLCGHSHLSWAVGVGAKIVVNPGSVGLPAYADDAPPHAMQTGDPRARYALLERGGSGLDVTPVFLEYDVRPAVRAARENGREDWAAWLATGKA
jgi:predicted phosphodiesterase